MGATLLLDVSPRFAMGFPHWILWLLIFAMTSLFVGFLTPILALLCCALELIGYFNSGAGDAHAFVYAIQALAVALLGPGAYSLDARLFGRRVLVVPPGKPPRDR